MSGSETRVKRSGAFDWVVDRHAPQLARGNAIPAQSRPLPRQNNTDIAARQSPGKVTEQERFPFPGKSVLEITRSFPCYATEPAAGESKIAVLFVDKVPHRTAVDPAIHTCFFGSLANFSTCRPRAFDVVLSGEPRSAAELLPEFAFHANLLRAGGLLHWRIAPAPSTDTWVFLRTEARRRGLRLLDLEPLQDGTFQVTFRR